MRYYYRGSTLLIRFKTKEMPDRQTITGYDISATIMGYEGVVDAIDNYSFNITFDEAITATLPEGHTPIVLSLSKDGVTALGQVKGLAAVEPSINETCGITDIVTCEVTIEDVTLNYGMVFNNVVTYQDLTDEQKTAMMAGIQSDADELFAELGQTIIDGNLAVDALEAKIPVANDAILAANNAADLATTKAGLAQDAADLANNKANLANSKATLAQEAADLANEVATHPPVITEGTWHYWNATTNVYVDTNIAATPYENYLQNTTDTPPLTEAQWSVWSKEQGDYAKEQGDYAKEQGELAQTARENIEGDLALKIDKASITNELGDSEDLVVSQKGLAALNLDIKAIQPAVQFLKRVTADGGTVVDKSLLAKVYTEFNQSLANTHCLYFPQIGIKERTSGINKYVNKLYDLSANNNDAVQATEATQPYIGGYIAPNEFRCLKYLQGQTQTGEITIPTKSYLATDSWTLTIILKANKRASTRILLGANSYINIGTSVIVIDNGTSATLTGIHTFDVGKIAQIEFQYSNGTGLIKVNNVPLATTVISTTMSFTRLAYSSTNPFDGSIYYYHLENVRISESDSQKRYNYLRSLFPEIEGIGIGNQFWQTSNVEQTVAGNGTAIPEVQGANTASNPELITNAADREFTSDTGFWTKSAGYSIADGVCHIVANSGGNGLSRELFTIGKEYSITYTVKNFISGSIRVDCGSTVGTIRSADGTYQQNLICAGNSAVYFVARSASTVLDIDDISIKEVGWADLTTPAWCYYNNDVALGAVYGKLYNWYAIDLINKYAPQGYRVPTSADFTQLATFLGGTSVAGGKLKKEGLTYWNTPNTGATNESGFSTLPNGWRRGDTGVFVSLNTRLTIASTFATGTLILTYDSVLFNFGNHFGSFPQTGQALRYIRTSPTVPQRGVIRASSNANHASTPLAIPVPLGCQVESIRIRNKQASTNLTNVSATHNNTGGTSLGTLITGKTVNAGVSTIFVATQLDMASQETDGTIRILATGNGNEGMDAEVIYKAMAL